MSELISIENLNGKLVTSSREVANNFGKENKHVMEAIRSLETSVEDSTHLFIPSNYKDSYGRLQNEYLLTRDGFSLLVMGFTGNKALEWKLKYIEVFNKMEQELQAPMSNLSPQLQLLINMELKQTEIETAIAQMDTRIDGLKDVIALDTTSWRADVKNLITQMAIKLGGYEHIGDLRKQSYELLNMRMGVSLTTRLTNKRRRMAEEGISKSKRDKLNPLDVIAEDKKLVEGYVAIIKNMAIKYDVVS